MSDPIVRFRGVEKVYDAGGRPLPILHGVDLEILRGEYLGIVGQSGSGKTTLLNLLGLMDRPTRGVYELEGQDVSRMSDDRLSRVRNRSIGFVFQSFNLIPQLTVLENVEVPLFYARAPRRERHGRCTRLLDAVGLGHRLHHHPTQLSGGEQQRVAVARALVNDPLVVLADEPTGNLDSKSGDEVLALFHGLHAEGRTIVMVTHNPEIAGALPRVVTMRDGYVVDDRATAGSATDPRAELAGAEA